MKPETNFRTNKVRPFLNRLSRSIAFPIQQKTIRGDADFIICAQGFFVWLELKVDEGKPDALQVYKAKCVKQTGGIALLARPDNWDLVADFLTLLDKGIYDKNVLRTIEQYELSRRVPKADALANEGSTSLQDNAHRKSSAKRDGKNAGSVQEGSNVSPRQRRRSRK